MDAHDRSSSHGASGTTTWEKEVLGSKLLVDREADPEALMKSARKVNMSPWVAARKLHWEGFEIPDLVWVQ